MSSPVSTMEWKISSGESDSPAVSNSVPENPFFQGCPLPQGNLETVDLNIVKSEVEKINVKQEIMEEDNKTSKGAFQTSQEGMSKSYVITSQKSTNDVPLPRVDLWPVTITSDSDTGPSVSSYDDHISYELGVPGLSSGDPLMALTGERLLSYQQPTDVEENDPLADPSLDESSRTVVDVEPSSNPSTEPKIAKTTQEELSLSEEISNDKRLIFTSITNPGASKLPVCSLLESMKSSIQEIPLNSDRELPFPEPARSSIKSPMENDSLQSTVTGSKKFSDQRKLALKTKSRACQASLSRPEKEFLKMLFGPSSDCQTSSSHFSKRKLDQQAKSIIYNVVSYFKEKRKKFHLNYNALTVASDATKIPKPAIQNIVTVGRKSLQDDKTLEVPIFGSNHTEKCKNCGDVLVDFAIREIIFNGYIEDQKALTMMEISAYLDADELFVCQDFLRRRIKALGFELMSSIATTKYIPLERPDLAAARYRFLQDIQKYRIMNRQLVYVFETDLSKVVHGKVTWEPVEGHPTKHDTHLMTVIYAAKESGFIDSSLLVHSDFVRQHHRRMWPLTLFWLNLHLPKLPRGSVVVLGHNRHHFVKPAKPKPDASWPRQDIVKWLHDHQEESFNSAVPAAVLLEKVQTIDVGSKFGIDDLIISHGHIPLHLPPNHRELNPVELVWRKILEGLSSVNTSNEGPMKDFLQNEFDSVAPSELQEAFELAKRHENILRQLDMRIDEPVAEVIRRVGGILDRNLTALEEDESGEEDAQTDHVLDGLLERIVVKSSECTKNKSKEDESPLVHPRKKTKTADTGTQDECALPISQKSVPSWHSPQGITTQETDSWDNSQLRSLDGNLGTSDVIPLFSVEKMAIETEAPDCKRVGLNDQNAQQIPSLPSRNSPQGLDGCDNPRFKTTVENLKSEDEVSLVQPEENRHTNRTLTDDAAGMNDQPAHSARSCQGIPTRRTGGASQMEALHGSQVELPEFKTSSCWSRSAPAPNVPDAVTGSIGHSRKTSSTNLSACKSQFVSDARNVSMETHFKGHDSKEMFWEPTYQNLTAWPKALTDSVFAIIPPIPNQEGSFVGQPKHQNSCIEVISLDDSDEENPGLVESTENEKHHSSLSNNAEIKEPESRTICSSPHNPLDSELGIQSS